MRPSPSPRSALMATAGRLSRPRSGARARRVPGALALASGLALVLAMPLGSAQAAAHAGSAAPAGGITQISSDPCADTYTECHTEVEPGSAAHEQTIVSTFAVSWFFGGGGSLQGWATSRDGGQTWQHGSLPDATAPAKDPGPYKTGGDNTVAYDARDHMWIAAWLGVPHLHPVNVVEVLVSHSRDGIHWSEPILVDHRKGYDDKEWITCDNSTSSRFYGHCYIEWDLNGLIFMATSTDGGLTWPVKNHTTGMARGIGGQPVVQHDGRVIVPITTFSSGQAAQSVFISDDGGQSWSAPNLIANIEHHNSAGGIRNGGSLLSAGIDASGRVYAVWSDCRFEPGCDANDLVLSSSADGITWTAPERIPLDSVGGGVDHFTPGLGVDPTTSGGHAHLALGYYYYPQTNCDQASCRLDVGYVSSINGGRTWSRPVHVAGPMRVTWLAPTFSGNMAGDYMSTPIIAGTNRAFPVFASASAPTGKVLHESMYTSAQQVRGGGLPATHPRVRGHAPLVPQSVLPSGGF